MAELSFEEGAQRHREALKNKGLNPKSSWKLKLAALGAGIGILGGAYGVHKAAEMRADPEWFEQPLVDESPLQIELRKVNDNLENPTGPTLRAAAKGSADELSEEELKNRGIDISGGKLTIRKVKGATYPSQYTDGAMEDADGRYGVWGEVMLPDPASGEMTGTGIYLSRNFYEPVPQNIPGVPRE